MAAHEGMVFREFLSGNKRTQAGVFDSVQNTYFLYY
jgi:hypothetical protein